MDDLELRGAIYRHFVQSGTAPGRREMSGWLPADADLDGQLRRLHDAHMIVLDDRPGCAGEIRMALPFSADPTDFRVRTPTGSWWANCAWDALAVLAALHEDGHVSSTWSDTGDPVEFDVRGAALEHDGFVHFRVPARRWWDDIVET